MIADDNDSMQIVHNEYHKSVFDRFGYFASKSEGIKRNRELEYKVMYSLLDLMTKKLYKQISGIFFEELNPKEIQKKIERVILPIFASIIFEELAVYDDGVECKTWKKGDHFIRHFFINDEVYVRYTKDQIIFPLCLALISLKNMVDRKGSGQTASMMPLWYYKHVHCCLDVICELPAFYDYHKRLMEKEKENLVYYSH
jgi:hypothetical protein